MGRESPLIRPAVSEGGFPPQIKPFPKKTPTASDHSAAPGSDFYSLIFMCWLVKGGFFFPYI